MLKKTSWELTPRGVFVPTTRLKPWLMKRLVCKIFLRDTQSPRRRLLDAREWSCREGSSGVRGAVETVQVSDRLLQLVSATEWVIWTMKECTNWLDCRKEQEIFCNSFEIFTRLCRYIQCMNRFWWQCMCIVHGLVQIYVHVRKWTDFNWTYRMYMYTWEDRTICNV